MTCKELILPVGRDAINGVIWQWQWIGLEAFLLLLNPVFGIFLCKQIWTDINTHGTTPAQGHQNLCQHCYEKHQPIRPARSAQMCCEDLNLSSLSFHFRVLFYKGEWEGTYHLLSKYDEPHMIRITWFNPLTTPEGDLLLPLDAWGNWGSKRLRYTVYESGFSKEAESIGDK